MDHMLASWTLLSGWRLSCLVRSFTFGAVTTFSMLLKINLAPSDPEIFDKYNTLSRYTSQYRAVYRTSCLSDVEPWHSQTEREEKRFGWCEHVKKSTCISAEYRDRHGDGSQTTASHLFTALKTICTSSALQPYEYVVVHVPDKPNNTVTQLWSVILLLCPNFSKYKYDYQNRSIHNQLAPLADSTITVAPIHHYLH